MQQQQQQQSQGNLFADQLPPINERLILSLFDNSGTWSEPYVKAGYPVIRWDLEHEGDLLEWSDRKLEKLMMNYGEYIYGIIAAPPCTEFAASGARWWEEKDKNEPEKLSTAIALTEMVILLKEQAERENDTKIFWCLENPVGRIASKVPQLQNYKKWGFNPCDFGDPYTKKTFLYGEFNEPQVIAPVLPLYGSLIHSMGSKQKKERSVTPQGFANAFFKANQ